MTDDRKQEEPAAPPPVYLALDLWMALGLDSTAFDGYYDRNGWADTWSNLLAEVRRSGRMEKCNATTPEGEPCVIQILGHIGPHVGASDVGSSEPLPMRCCSHPKCPGSSLCCCTNEEEGSPAMTTHATGGLLAEAVLDRRVRVRRGRVLQLRRSPGRRARCLT